MVKFQWTIGIGKRDSERNRQIGVCIYSLLARVGGLKTRG